MAKTPTKRKMRTVREETVEFVPAPRQEWSVDVDSPSDSVPLDVAERLAGSSTSDRPDISAFPAALDEMGRPLFRSGDRIVIERYAYPVLDDNRWLDTHVYTVHAIDERTGVMRLWDETIGHWGYDNFITGPKVGQVYRMATRRILSTKGRRGRKPKSTDARPQVVTEPGVKRKRGRPPGAKNRPKEVVAAEKAERMEKMRAKRLARESRKLRGGR